MGPVMMRAGPFEDDTIAVGLGPFEIRGDEVVTQALFFSVLRQLGMLTLFGPLRHSAGIGRDVAKGC